MTVYDLAPSFVKLKYTFAGMQHTQTIPCALAGDLIPGEEPDISRKVGSPTSFSTAIDTYVAVFKTFFGAGMDINFAEAWSKPTPADDPIWIFTYAVGVAGTAGVASKEALQMTVTFRTALGHLAKWYAMEVSGGFDDNSRDTYPFSDGGATSIATYLTGGNSIFLGRDNASLVVPISVKWKYNDVILNKRLGI